MRSAFEPLVAMTVWLAACLPAAATHTPAVPARRSAGNATGAVQLAQTRHGPPAQIDVNRPRSPFDCNTPLGENWYGSTKRCLAELCAGHNVYNEYIFEGTRRRKNVCYGQSPTDYPSDE